MAMTKCKECGASISSKAKACPQCGCEQVKHYSVGWIFLVGFIALIIGSLSGRGERSHVSPAEIQRDKESAWIAQGEVAVKAKLKDPGSAEFRNVFFSRSGKLPMACGEVNFKNSFGGYAGFQRFVSAGEAGTTFLESDVKDFDQVWNKMCSLK